MKHCIIVKWKLGTNKATILEPVKQLLLQAKDIDGVSDVKFFENVIALPNRYDLMIQVIMDKDALENWNQSEVHKTWKSLYGEKIESKAIFDYE